MVKRCFFIIFVICGLAITTPVYAADINAKALGMGGAFTAIADDASAIYWNPAGLTEITYMSLSPSVGVRTPTRTAWEKFYEVANGDILDSPDNGKVEMAALLGLALGNYGAGVIASGEVALNADDSSRADGTAEYILAYTVATARRLNNPKWDLGAASIGFNFKALDGRRYDYELTPAEDPEHYNVKWVEARGTGYSADMGMRFKLTNAIVLGLMVRDLIGNMTWSEVTTSFTRDAQTGEEEIDISFAASRQERLPTRLRAGVGVNIPYLRATIAADMEGDGTLHLGFEKRLLFNGVSLRAGKEIPPKGEGLLTVGAGINLGPFSIDAAIGSADSFKEDITGAISGKIRF